MNARLLFDLPPSHPRAAAPIPASNDRQPPHVSVFDVQAPDGGHQLSPGVNNEPARFPKCAARFKELFGLPHAGATEPANARRQP